MDGNFIKRRVNVIKEIQNSIRRVSKLTDGAPSCIQDDLLANSFKLLGRIGSGSVNGEAFKVCFPIECNDYGMCECSKSQNQVHLAVKKIPLSKEDYLLS